MREISSATKNVGGTRHKANHQQRSNLIKKTWDLVQKVVIPNLKLKTHHNCKYSYNDFFKLLTFAGINNGCAEGSANNLNFLSDEECPNGDTLLYHLKKFTTIELLESYEKITDQIISMAKNRGLLNGPVDCAIDFTDELYYGDRKDPMVVGTKPQKGTSKAFRFATITIIEDECRLTIRALPVGKDTPKHEVVADLVKYTQERIEIGVLCVDRGFYSVDVFTTLNNLGVKYLIPAVQNPKNVREMRGLYPPQILPITIKSVSSDNKSVTANLVMVLDIDMEKRGFVTNMDLDRKRTRQLSKLYSKRWGIETSYRVKKDFRPKTTSKNYIIRLFYFLFSVALYNLWELVNVILALVEKIDPKTPVIAAKLFGTIIFRAFDLNGIDPPPYCGQ
ncbi:MAG: transposase [Methanoregula sp.]|uniref:transposase n=1 Tax=Methanoregula sp. TaxID=2052170 RepID=UPI003C1C2B6D